MTMVNSIAMPTQAPSIVARKIEARAVTVEVYRRRSSPSPPPPVRPLNFMRAGASAIRARFKKRAGKRLACEYKGIGDVGGDVGQGIEGAC